MIAFEYLYNRRVPLIYVCPPVCDFDFSGTGEPTIYLAPIERIGAPTGLVFGGVGGYVLSWGVVPGALCYSVYRSVDEDNPYGAYQLVAECLSTDYYQVPDGDDHYWRIDVITEDGVTDMSPPVRAPGGSPTPPPPPPPPPICAPETGDAVPFGANAFDVTADMGENYVTCQFSPTPKTVVDASNAVPWDEYTQVPGAFVYWHDEDGFDYWKFELAGDYPPGEYVIRYVSGVTFTEPSGLPFPNDVSGACGLQFFADNEHYSRAAVDTLGDQLLRQGMSCNSAGGVAFPAAGFVTTGFSLAAVEASLQGSYRPPAEEYFWGGIRQSHSNLGGKIFLVQSLALYTYPFNNPPFNFYPVFQVLQVSGQIQQPRQVRVSDWASVAPYFPVAVNGFWNGDFDTRTVYTTNTCQWDAPAASPFGGARVYYSQARPESPSGCAWVCEIYVGATLHWQGVKIIGKNPSGLYQRTALSALLPACLRIENKTNWPYPAP
jgi:hypothetical protein